VESKCFTWNGSDSIICSYALAGTLRGVLPDNAIGIKKFPFDLVILDEAHYLKTPKSQRAQIVLGKKGIVRFCQRIWALTGTPCPNNAAELWSLLFTFGATSLKYEKFIDRYCEYYLSPHGIQVTNLKMRNLQELKRVIASVTLRRTKKEVNMELPAIYYSTVPVEPGEVKIDESASFISWVFPTNRKEELMKEVESQRSLVKNIFDSTGAYSSTTLKALEVLEKSVSTLRRYTGLQKLPAITDLIIEQFEAKAYEKLVVFAIHQDVIHKLRLMLSKAGLKPVTYYGGTPDKKKQAHIDLFQNNPKVKVFIANIHAAGVAINLTAAHQVLFAEMAWSPSANAQAAMRCHRIGQTQPVFVRFMSLAGSIDEKVTTILRRKAQQIFQIFDKHNRDPRCQPGIVDDI
jgi:SNF2 family DNA or RNA helicase